MEKNRVISGKHFLAICRAILLHGKLKTVIARIIIRVASAGWQYVDQSRAPLYFVERDAG